MAELEEALRLLVPTAADELHWRELDREKEAARRNEQRSGELPHPATSTKE